MESLLLRPIKFALNAGEGLRCVIDQLSVALDRGLLPLVVMRILADLLRYMARVACDGGEGCNQHTYDRNPVAY